MNRFQKGLIESITGLVSGIVLTTIIGAFVKDGILPNYTILLFGLLSVIGNIATLKSLRYVGMLYTIGWLIGSWIMKDIFSPVDWVFNIAGPIAILIARAYFWIKKLR